jgi:hypothetical protein
MNDKLKQLSLMAGGSHYPIINPQLQEKFAELIIQECIGIIEGGRFLHDEAPDAKFSRACSGAIKRHFGIE